MPILRRMVESRGSPENPKTSLSDPSVLAHVGGQMTATRQTVTPESALTVSAVYSCVRIIAEGLSTLPVHLYRREGKVRRDADDHPLAKLLADAPNGEIDAGEMWRSVLVWLLLRGNGYVYVQRNGSGTPVALWPLPARCVLPYRTGQRQIAYQVALSDDVVAGDLPSVSTVPATSMLHFRAFGLGRLEGLSPVGAVRESVAIAMSAQRYAGSFYANDASPGGYLKVPHQLTDEQFSRLERSWLDAHQGLGSAHHPAVLEGGAEWQSVGLSPKDAEFITSRKWELSEISRVFGVPPHMIGDVDRSTSWGSGIDEQNRGFVKHSLTPWASRLERVIRHGLILPAPFRDPQLHIAWSMDGLLRGDVQSRHQAYATGRQWGWLSVNDIRALEDQEPVEDGGDIYLQPMNMVPAGSVLSWHGHNLEDPDGDDGDGEDRGLQLREVVEVDDEPLLDVHVRELSRFLGVQADALTEAVASEPRPLRDLWDADRWDGELAGLLYRLSVLVAAGYGRRLVDGYDPEGRMGGWLAANSRIAAENVNGQTLQDLVDGTDGLPEPSRIRELLVGTVVADRLVQLATSRVTTVGQAAVQDAAVQAGRRTKTWRVTSANPRSSHAAMDGETVPIGKAFSNGAQYPGDPNLRLDERARCQCRLDVN